MLKIGFIGGGAVNFGGGEGPWDHASRLETLGDIQLVAVADPDAERVSRALAQRANAMYDGTRVYTDVAEMLGKEVLDAVWIGVPPSVHGTAAPGKDLEIMCADAGVHMFIEKPLAAARPAVVRSVATRLAASPVLVSVGYMFRYSQAADYIRSLFQKHGVMPAVFTARYNCAYSEIAKRSWWDRHESGGPIVEQATHFLDLARFLVGNVDLSSVSGVQVPAASAVGHLSDMPRTVNGGAIDAEVPEGQKIPRATCASWKFESGAIGSLTHGVYLHGRAYEAALEIWGDGLQVAWEDPYGVSRLRVRRTGQDSVETVSFEDDDPYMAEDQAFIAAVRSGDPDAIRCSYSDAFETFELSWAITDAAAKH